jgi:hypothetical protein
MTKVVTFHPSGYFYLLQSFIWLDPSFVQEIAIILENPESPPLSKLADAELLTAFCVTRMDHLNAVCQILVHEFGEFAAVVGFEILDILGGQLLAVLKAGETEQKEALETALTRVFTETRDARMMTRNLARLACQIVETNVPIWMVQTRKLLSSEALKGLRPGADIYFPGSIANNQSLRFLQLPKI